MRHADDHFLDAGDAGVLDEVVQQRDEGIAALEREALLADVLGVQVALEPLGRGELPEDVALLLGAEALLAAARPGTRPAATGARRNRTRAQTRRRRCPA